MPNEQAAMLMSIVMRKIIIDPNTNMPVVVFHVPTLGRTFGLWIGIFEANGIMLVTENVVTPRPMTHDLMKNVIEAMGGTVTRVAFTDLRDNTFYATVFISLAGGEIEVDSRPSDAISLAVRFKVPILADHNVIERAEPIQVPDDAPVDIRTDLNDDEDS